MYKFLLIVCSVAMVHSQTVSPEMMSMFNTVFGKANTTAQTTTTARTDAGNSDEDFNYDPNEVVECQLEDGSTGECVAYILCDNNNNVIKDGSGLIDLRSGFSPCRYLETCCKVADKRPPDNPIRPQTKSSPIIQKGCGYRNPEGAGLRTTGESDGETKFGEFPWMVAILKVEPLNKDEPDGETFDTYVGGGSLIHQSVVLTAAHVVATVPRLKVRAGEWDTRTTDEVYPHQDRDVISKEVHKDYNDGNLFYDVALLFLAKPMEAAPNVGVACLPPPREQTTSGTKCFATGWGKTTFDRKGRHQVILKKVELPVVKHYACEQALQRTRLGDQFQLHVSFMCAGGQRGVDTCKGDGGSPLSCPIEFETDRYIQSGIVSWGIGCGDDGTPGVYIDVALMRYWIDSMVLGKGYRINAYDHNNAFGGIEAV